MSYTAYVCKIFTRPVVGLDNLVLGTCGNYNVLVSKDTVDGTLGVYFDTGGQLSEEFCKLHDLVRRRLPDGSKVGGFLEENRRIRSIKFKGIKSDGLWMPIGCLAYTKYDLSKLEEGSQFEELNGHPICQKYLTPAAIRSAHNAKTKGAKAHKILVTFPKHIETGHFLRSLQTIPFGALIMISSKAHGTSSRVTNVNDTLPPKWYSKLDNLFFSKLETYHNLNKLRPWMDKLKNFAVSRFPRKEWVHLIGTKNVVLNHKPADYKGYYGSEEFRYKINSNIKLHKNEILYGEIVGYTQSNKPIMNPHNPSKLKNKQFEKRFGSQMVYKYGCLEGECKLLVYRIAMVNEDGILVEYPWWQVEKRCKELGLQTVTVINQFVYDGDAEGLKVFVDGIVNGKSGSEAIPAPEDGSHIQEGVVVRADSVFGTQWLKHKSFLFGVLEGYAAEDENSIDLEDVS